MADPQVLVITPTQATARSINLEIQRLRYAGQLSLSVGLSDGAEAHVGDLITTRRNDPSLVTSGGTAVRNRQTWTVDAVRADGGVTASNAYGATVALPASYVADAVELGWAVTGYGNQGTTVDVGIAVLEPSTSRASAYVAMTRGRERNHAWIPGPTGTGTGADAFAATITAPDRALSAHAVACELGGGTAIQPPTHRVAAPALGLSP